MKKIGLMLCLLCMASVSYAQIAGRVAVDSADIELSPRGAYTHVTFTGSVPMTQIGAPRLPVIHKTYVIPEGSEVTGITITYSDTVIIAGSHTIYPAQPPKIVGDNTISGEFMKNDSIYSLVSPFPEDGVHIISDGYDCGYHLITVEISPLLYIPATGVLILRNIDYTINFNTGSAPTSLSVMSKLRYNDIQSMITAMVCNKEDVKRFAPGATVIEQQQNVSIVTASSGALQRSSMAEAELFSDVAPDCIIITADSLVQAFEPLAEWRNRTGYRTIIKTVEDIYANYLGSDHQDQIRNYLYECWYKWSTLNIVLGGDDNIIPAKVENGKYGHPVACDLYYRTSEKWIYPSMGSAVGNPRINLCGRIPGANKNEIQNIVNKILIYEKGDFIDGSYINNYLGVTGCMSSDGNTELYNNFKEKIYDCFSKYKLISGKYLTDDYNCSGSIRYNYSKNDDDLYDLSKECRPQYANNQADELNAGNFFSALNGTHFNNTKFHFIYHEDHSSEYSFGSSIYDKGDNINGGDMNRLGNCNGHYQIMFSNGCDPGNFLLDCVAGRYIKNPNAGGIAFIGNSDIGYVGDEYHKTFILYLIYGGDTYSRLGGLYNLVQVGNVKMVMFGDPLTPVWTTAPKTLTLQAGDISYDNGKTVVPVTINGLQEFEKATVCIKKGDDIFGVTTVSAKDNSCVFKYIPHTGSTVSTYVTVTSHNYKPITIEINDGIPANRLNISGTQKIIYSNPDITTITDAAIAGATVTASIPITNSGSSDAAGVTAKLSFTPKVWSDTLITITNGTCEYGTIPKGVTVTKDFTFKVGENIASVHNHDNSSSNLLKFAITDSDGNLYEEQFKMNILKTDLKISNLSVERTSNTIIANFTVTNTGDTDILIERYIGTYKINNTGEEYRALRKMGKIIRKNEASEPLTYYLGPIPTDAISVDVKVEIKDCYGKIYTLGFNTLEPQIAAVNGFTFSNAENAITLNWTKSPDSNIDGYNVYRYDVSPDGQPLPASLKVNKFPVGSGTYTDYVPFGSHYYYDVAPVAASGRIGSRCAKIYAYTSYPQKAGFPVFYDSNADGNNGFSKTWRFLSPVMLQDVDGDGKDEIFTSMMGNTNSGPESYIIALNGNGNEINDLDGSDNRYYGFSKISAAIRGAVAIDDIFDNGSYKLINASKDPGYSVQNGYANYFTCYNLKSDSGTKNWEKIYSGSFGPTGPIIAPLNGNDGEKSIVMLTDKYGPGGGTIKIFNNRGELRQTITDSVRTDNTASLTAVQLRSYGAPAVADINGDCKTEIIAACDYPTDEITEGDNIHGIYVWEQNNSGRYIGNKIFSEEGIRFHSDVVVGDIDGDGNKEIVFAATKWSKANDFFGKEYIKRSPAIYLLKKNPAGEYVKKYNTPFSGEIYNDYYTVGITLGDITGDGKLEIVLCKNAVNNKIVVPDTVYVYKNNCELLFKKAILNLSTQNAPLIADIDGDGSSELIVQTSGNETNDGGKIYAFKANGSEARGFPIALSWNISSGIAAGDVDGDGKTEIVAATNRNVYCWKTIGDANRIEWGMIHGNAQNTGEYKRKTVLTTRELSSPAQYGASVIIPAGVTYTVKSGGKMAAVPACGQCHGAITVSRGGSLVIDGGTVENMLITALPGANVTIVNGGKVNMTAPVKKKIDIRKGATLNMFGEGIK